MKDNYKCGHEGKPVILDGNALSLSIYMEWVKSEGYEGDKSMCWECWNKKEQER